MGNPDIQFRECQNPACGLRYPRLEGSEFGERCPICLGTTVVVGRVKSEIEPGSHGKPSQMPTGPRALLDNVRSALNVGSIFRSADGFAVSHLYLCGITPTPEQEALRKTALGAEQYVPWSGQRNAVKLISELKEHGYCIWALEKTEESISLETAVAASRRNDRLVLVVGNERAGIDPGILDLADSTVHIDMHGGKRSFNVAVAFAIAAYQITRR